MTVGNTQVNLDCYAPPCYTFFMDHSAAYFVVQLIIILIVTLFIQTITGIQLYY